MSLLIRGAKILGSANAFRDEPRDLFINGGRIAAIGNFPRMSADAVVEARGAYVSPGFIDMNTDSDHYLTIFDEPDQEDFIRQGVTTIIGGMCGASLAPLLYGSLESIRKWGDPSAVNVNWHSLKEFLETLDQKPLAVNFATLAGHSTIRRALVGEQIRDLTKNELQIFGTMLRHALDEGAFGLSSGLGYAHSRKTPYSEIKFLTDIVREYDGVYATHLRNNTAELASAVGETIKIAREARVRTVISHFMPIIGTEKEYEKALAHIESLPLDVQLKFDAYPSDVSILAIYTFLPEWAQNGGREQMLANLKDDWLRSKIIKEIPVVHPQNFIVAQAPGNEFLIGKSLTEIAAFYDETHYGSALARLMMATQLKAVVHYKNINATLIPKIIASPRSFIASNSASLGKSGKMLKTDRATSTFTKFIELTESRKLMALEDAIKKITREPAENFGLVGRGEIKTGAAADLAVFKVQDGPSEGQKTLEIKSVIVNGELAVHEGVLTEKRAGKNLRHTRSPRTHLKNNPPAI